MLSHPVPYDRVYLKAQIDEDTYHTGWGHYNAQAQTISWEDNLYLPLPLPPRLEELTCYLLICVSKT